RPPAAHCRAEPVVLSNEGNDADHGHDDLHQGAAQDGHELAERREEDVTRFMKREVYEVEERAVGEKPVERMRDEAPRPPGEQREQARAADRRPRHSSGSIITEAARGTPRGLMETMRT